MAIIHPNAAEFRQMLAEKKLFSLIFTQPGAVPAKCLVMFWKILKKLLATVWTL